MNTEIFQASGEKKNDSIHKLSLHLCQQEVYYDQIIDPESPHYNLGMYVILRGALNVPCFIEVIKSFPERFDAFRQKFDFKGTTPLCYFTKEPVAFEVAEIDFSKRKRPEKEAQTWMRDRFNQAFDLEADLLFEYALLKVHEDEYWWYSRHHHLIIDGYGLSVCLKYVAETYSGLIKKNKTSIHFNYPSYRQEIFHSLAYTDSVAYEKDARYWNQYFKSISEPLFKRRFFTGQEQGGGEVTIKIKEHQRTLFKETAKYHHTNLNQLTLAALVICFFRTENKKELVFGMVSHNRKQKHQKNIVGMFSRIIPLRISHKPDQTLEDFFKEIKNTKQNHYVHSDYPLSHLNRNLNLLARHRKQLFDIILNYALLDFDHSFEGLRSINTYELLSQRANTPLELHWRDYGSKQDLELNIKYQQSYFTKEEIELLGQRILFILDQFQTAAAKKLADIDIIPEEEKQKLLVEFNNTKVDYPKDKTIVDLFEEQVKRTPERIALVFEEEALSYRQLSERANRLAHYLRKKGVKEESLVAICIGRSLEMVVGILGILKAGGAYVPIDPTYPRKRIEYILKDTQTQWLVSTRTHSDLVNHNNIAFLDINRALSGKQSKADFSAKLLPDRLAYIIYTSGSTGRPKGVMIEHHSVVNLIAGQTRAFDIQEDERILQFSNYVFDASVEQIFLALLNGGCLVLLSEEILPDPEKVSTLIKEEGITHLHATPGFLQEIPPDKPYPSLRRVIAGGDTCPVELAARWGNSYEFYNEYGPTETTVTSFEYKYSSASSSDPGLPIGKPVSNTQAYILGKSGALSGVGIAGELYIGGAGVSRGYLNRPSMTSDRFIENPYGDGRLYKTGDLCKWLADGNMAFMGRLDEQVKIRGYRIELGEIEAVLRESSLVKQSVVLAGADSNGMKRLIAYVIPADNYDKVSIQKYLRGQLPDYMVPSLIIALEHFPLTSNGKIDKKALPDPDASAYLTGRYVAPRNGQEAKLAIIWEELLDIEQVGIHDNFFDLGGNSLLAVQLMSRINKQFSKELPIAVLIQTPTIALLSPKLSADKQEEAAPVLIRMDRQEKEYAIFCVPGAGGNVIAYYHLAKLLGKSCSLYAFQTPGTDGKTAVLKSVAAMASAYIAEIRRIKDTGPYLLAGYSFGGHVAYEMALQLERQGEQLMGLIMLDAFLPVRSFRAILGWDTSYAEYLSLTTAIYGRYYDKEMNVSPGRFEGKRKEEQFALVHEALTKAGIEVTPLQVRGFAEVCINNISSEYVFRGDHKLKTPIILIKADEADLTEKGMFLGRRIEIVAKRNDYGWTEATEANVYIEEVPGDHWTFLHPPQVEQVADRLKKQLRLLL